ISFHATKVSGIGEGAAIVTGDKATGITLKSRGNFGFSGSRQASLPGINSKLSEYAGALGNAFLDTWDERRAQWSWLKSAFLYRLSGRQQFTVSPDFESDWVSSYGQILLPEHLDASDVIEALESRGIEARKWWGDGCHRQPPYRSFAHNELPVTDGLAKKVVGLPYWIGMSDSDFDTVFHALDQF
ncbi:MAG: DegT/DnrJ/EryC1/StrS family aminotransferase, partial [Aestuariivirga sp.]